MSLIAEQWFSKALALDDKESIFVPCPNKREQTTLLNSLLSIKKIMMTVYPGETTKIDITRYYNRDDHQFYIKISKDVSTMLEGFLKDANGTTKVVCVETDLDKARRISLMVQDGLTQEEIEELEGALSPEDTLKYFPKRGL